MFEKGLDANGVSLESIGGSYSPATIIIKQEQSLPFDRITLFDTGEFYDSFSVTAQKDGVIIYADTEKEGGVDLRERWGVDILGLSDESIQELSKQLIQDVRKVIKGKILQ